MSDDIRWVAASSADDLWEGDLLDVEVEGEAVPDALTLPDCEAEGECEAAAVAEALVEGDGLAEAEADAEADVEGDFVADATTVQLVVVGGTVVDLRKKEEKK